MLAKKGSFNSGVTFGGWLSLAFLSVTFVWIGIAYGAQLNSTKSRVEFRHTFSTDGVATSVNVTAPDGTIRSHKFLGDLVKAADSDRSKLLWGMYPASIRGRAFSGATEIGSPFASSGGW